MPRKMTAIMSTTGTIDEARGQSRRTPIRLEERRQVCGIFPNDKFRVCFSWVLIWLLGSVKKLSLLQRKTHKSSYFF